MHPVRQNIAWHPEMGGDVGVTAAVYDPALQQPAVVRGQVPEEGAKPIRGIVHQGDLGDHDDTPGQAGFPGVLFLPSGRFGPRHTWECLQAQRNAPEVPGLGIFLATLACSGEDGDSLDSGLAGGGDYRRLVRGRDMGSTAAHDFWEHENRHTLVTELSESGAGDEANHEYCGARLARHALAVLPCADGSEAARPRRD